MFSFWATTMTKAVLDGKLQIAERSKCFINDTIYAGKKEKLKLESITWPEATYPNALADFHHDVALRSRFMVQTTSSNEHNYTQKAIVSCSIRV